MQGWDVHRAEAGACARLQMGTVVFVHLVGDSRGKGHSCPPEHEMTTKGGGLVGQAQGMPVPLKLQAMQAVSPLQILQCWCPLHMPASSASASILETCSPAVSSMSLAGKQPELSGTRGSICAIVRFGA